jgi:hypothetical protein
MTVDQQAAYWKDKARKHEARANARGDYDDIKAKAAELDKIREQQMSETEKAVNKAREEALAEGKRQAMTDLSTKYTRAMLETALTTRGRTPEQVETLLRHVNFESYVANGEPDTDAIAASKARPVASKPVQPCTARDTAPRSNPLPTGRKNPLCLSSARRRSARATSPGSGPSAA